MMRYSVPRWFSRALGFVVAGCSLLWHPSVDRGAESVPLQLFRLQAEESRENGAGGPVETGGLQGTAWLFDGKGGSLVMTPEGKAEASEDLTLACWINLDHRLGAASETMPAVEGDNREGKRLGPVFTRYTHTIFSWDGQDGLQRRLFVIRPEFKGLSYRLGFSDGKKTFYTAGPGMTSGMWYHVAVAFGKGKVAFYLDGVLFDEQEAKGLMPADFAGGRLGMDKAGDEPFAGKIESVEASPSVLAEEQISALYRKGLGSARMEANRKQLLADFPDAGEQLDNPESRWSQVLVPPYWYSKAWNWNETWDQPWYDADSVMIVAASDSPNREGAHFQCDGTTDDITIQRALDTLPEAGGKVILREGTYRLTNAIMPKSHTDLEIHGTLVVADAVTSKLTQDTLKGDNTFHVADAGKFRVGQWVTVVDDFKVDHYGGWENPNGGRKYPECARIAAIDGNAIKLEGIFNRHSNWHRWNMSPEYRKDYLVEGNAFMTTSHSAILVQRQSFVTIHGPGIVCGNRMNQSATAPLSTYEGGEEMRANSGIVVYDSCFVRIKGLTVRNATLHNVSFRYAENCEATGVETYGANDKNFASVRTSRLRLVDNDAHDSVQEDGIIFYTAGHLALVGKNRIVDNRRLGLHVNPSCRFVTSIRNVMQGNGSNMTLVEGDERQSFSIEDKIGK